MNYSWQTINVRWRHWYTLQNGPLLSPVPTWHRTQLPVSPDVPPLPYSTSLWQCHSCLHPFPCPDCPSRLAAVSLFCVPRSLSLFCPLWFLDSTCQWSTGYWSLSVCLFVWPRWARHPPGPPMCSHVSICGSFLWLSHTPSVHVCHTFSPLVLWGPRGLLPHLGYCQWCWGEHRVLTAFGINCSGFVRTHTQQLHHRVTVCFTASVLKSLVSGVCLLSSFLFVPIFMKFFFPSTN